MEWYQWLAIACLAVDIAGLIIHLTRLISLGKPKDLSLQKGDIGPSLMYAFSGAMSPSRKESAFLHIPTYIAGIFYHLGTFISIFVFFFFLTQFTINELISQFIAGFMAIAVLCGVGILIKRMVVKRLRALSNPDDYISNLLVTFFQILTAAVLLHENWQPAYYIIVSILLVYIPLGKLKHAVYFFAARYHLGYFYGWRGVWPPKKI
jgi:hypothetical protein